jgi:hypothetical protein
VTRRRPLRTAGIALAVTATLATASAPAAAAPVAVAEGAARWTTGGSVASDLARAGVSIRPGSVSRIRGRRLALRITGGTTRTIEHGFGAALVLRKGRRAVRVTELRVRFGPQARITGRLDDGVERILFTLGGAELKRREGMATSRVLRPSLTADAARSLRARLGVRTLRRGPFGTLSITARERRPAAGPLITTTTTTVTTTHAPAKPAGCPAPTAAPTGTPAVSGGTLEWGFKTSFRTYIRSGAAHGSIAVSGGAVETPNGFTFTSPRGLLRADGTGDARYAGTVYFEGHGSGDQALLRLWICRPRVVLTSPTAGVLRADIASRTLESQEVVEYPNVEVAELDLTNTTPTTTGGTKTWTNVPTTLSLDAEGAFAGFYEAGQELDPLTFRLTTPTN